MPAVHVDLSELRGHDDLIANGSQCVSHKLLIREGAIDLRCVEKRHAESAASRISAIASLRSRVALR